jgi:hypothetical protein
MVMKGQWKTIEAVLAGIVVLMFLAAITTLHSASQTTVPTQGYRALYAVYEKGMLQESAAALDAQAIDDMAGATGYLAGYSHTVVICNATVCTADPPVADYVWASSVIVAGDESFAPAEVILYIYR